MGLFDKKIEFSDNNPERELTEDQLEHVYGGYIEIIALNEEIDRLENIINDSQTPNDEKKQIYIRLEELRQKKEEIFQRRNQEIFQRRNEEIFQRRNGRKI